MRGRAKQAIVTINFSSLLVGVEWRKVLYQKKKKNDEKWKKRVPSIKRWAQIPAQNSLIYESTDCLTRSLRGAPKPDQYGRFFLCVVFIRGIVIKSREETTAMVEPVGSRVGTIKQWVFILQVYGFSVTCKRVLQRSMEWYILKKYRKNI